MAFSKTPTQDTYDTKRFPLVGSPLQRDGLSTSNLKDQRFQNCYVEAIKAQLTDAKKYFCKKRNGLNRVNNPGLGTARGIHFEDTIGKVYMVLGTTLCYWNGTSVVTLATGIANSPNPVGFTTHLTTSVSVIMVTGTTGYVINPSTDAVTQITDPDFPNPHLAFPISLDGYLFLAKAGSADVYNSDLDDPLAWDPSQFITAEMYPDNIVALCKNNNYLVAVGTGSMEYFYDIGNATGSPLQRNDSAVQQMGTPAPFSVIQTEKEVVMVATTANGGRTVWVVEGFTATEIGFPPVNMQINNASTSIATVSGYCIRVGGHKFYVLCFPTLNRCWAYDFETKLWCEWSSTTVGGAQGIFLGKFATDSNNGFPYMLSDDGILFLMADQAYQDDGRAIQTQITTLKLDFDNMNRKDCSRVAIFGDWPLNVSSTITLEWSDDDYRTWSAPRTIQLSTALPVTRRLGKFRRRAFRLTHTDNTPLRLEGMEMDINNGSS